MLTLPISVFAVNNSDTSLSINWTPVICGTLGGLALFLYGMEIMTEAMKKSLGVKIRKIITSLSKNRFTGASTGIMVTMITQSTGATTVMLISFVESGLMQFYQTLPVILGANIGSTFLTQVIAFDIAGFALVPVFVGYILKTVGKGDFIKECGGALLGFGLVFYGMNVLGSSLEPLKDLPQLTEILTGRMNPVFGVLVGTLATAMIQSSPMFTGILMVFASRGLLSLENSFPLIIGSSIGTCLLIIISAIGSSVNSKRTMAAHVFVKVVGGFMFLPLVGIASKEMNLLALKFDISPERLVAHAHTVYNTAVVLFMLPFTVMISNFIKLIYKDKADVGNIPHLKYIDNSVLSMPHVALESALSETATVFKLAGRMFDYCVKSLLEFSPDNQELDKINQKRLNDLDIKENKIDWLEEEITNFLLSVSRRHISGQISGSVFGLLSSLECVERCGDIVHRSMKPLYKKLKMINQPFSENGINEISDYSQRISQQFVLIYDALNARDLDKLRHIHDDIEQINRYAEQLRLSHLQRLCNHFDNVVLTHEVHTELVDDLSDIASLLAKVTDTLSDKVLSVYKD